MGPRFAAALGKVTAMAWITGRKATMPNTNSGHTAFVPEDTAPAKPAAIMRRLMVR